MKTKLIIFASIILTLAGFSFASSTQAVIIPADRSIDWSQSGIPGGIPYRTTTCATINAGTYGNGTTDATSAIQTAINNCPLGQVVYLPAGTYRVSSAISLNRGITLRGAGPENTRIIGGNGSLVTISNPPTAGPLTANIISGANKGSTTITLDTIPQYLTIGKYIAIDQLNDPNLTTTLSSEGPGQDCNTVGGCGARYGPEDATRALGQWVKVTNISGNNVSFSPGLYHNFLPGLNPQIWYKVYYADLNGPNFLSNAGLEDLKLDNYEGTAPWILDISFTAYSWVRNVETSMTGKAHIRVQYSFGDEIRDSYLHDSFGSTSTGSYGILLGQASTNTLVQNNIINNVISGMILGGTTDGNVYAYNYVPHITYSPSNFLQAAMSTHDAHGIMNLYEGNVGGSFVADKIHGSSSNNTLFRNFFTGHQPGTTNQNRAVEIDQWNRYYNVVGNVLGDNSFTGLYENIAPQTCYISQNVIWQIGYSGIYNWSSTPTGLATYDNGVVPVLYDPLVNFTLLRHGNWDVVTNFTHWDPSIPDQNLPASLYLSSKPTWWPTGLAWPAIGSDISGGSVESSGHAYKIPAQLRYEAMGGGSSTCTSFTYSAWTPTPCIAGQTQTRTITSSLPSNCTGGSPLTTQTCATSCTENWSCGSYSPDPCTAGQTQTRTCTDSNNCGTYVNRPALTQTCSTPAVGGLTGYYTFDEMSGTTANDSSVNNYTGTLVNNPTWYAGGKINGELKFNVASDTSSYVSTTTPLSSYLGANQDGTLSAWVWPTTGGTGDCSYLAASAVITDSAGYAEIGLTGGNWCAAFGSNGTGIIVPATLNAWSLVTLTRANGVATFYINGVQAGTMSVGSITATYPIWIGRSFAGNSFRGAIDDVRIYNKALTLAEVQALYASGGTTSPSDTTAPTVTAFTIPSTATSLTVPVSLFTATDAVSVTGYLLTESSSAPLASNSNWTSTAPSSYTFTAQGSKTLYAWAKDAAGNVSTSLNDSVIITITIIDTTAPIISSVMASSIMSTGATIAWITNEPADSQVDYGTTTSYGSQTTLNPTLVTSHSQAIIGLVSSTIYHYRVKSKDASGNPATSQDYTFTTQPSGTTAFVFTKTLKLGMTNTDVWQLQRFLNTHGFPVAISPAVGSLDHENNYFGTKTWMAVKKFQKFYGISATGIVGPLTRDKINAMNQ